MLAVLDHPEMIYDLSVYTGLSVDELAGVFASPNSPVDVEGDFFCGRVRFPLYGSINSSWLRKPNAEFAERLEQKLGLVTCSEIFTDMVNPYLADTEPVVNNEPIWSGYVQQMHDLLVHLKNSGVSFYVLASTLEPTSLGFAPLLVGHYDARPRDTQVNPNVAMGIGRILL